MTLQMKLMFCFPVGNFVGTASTVEIAGADASGVGFALTAEPPIGFLFFFCGLSFPSFFNKGYIITSLGAVDFVCFGLAYTEVLFTYIR